MNVVCQRMGKGVAILSLLFSISTANAGLCTGQPKCEETYSGAGTGTCTLNSNGTYTASCGGWDPNGSQCCDSNDQVHDIQGCTCTCNSSHTSSSYTNCGY
ncbi:hypothetical protein [Legionella sp. km772]|uniref:hypothetical protein n=1 Tax=Legionella sp. km772 TaxID=2498111 RepID=UPI000F8E9190|nr:hypothetical protein [Legionella sp. km772]RUR12090.1 hypothetical protein ELY15_06235 [Legionella sp. km772]